MRVIGGVLAAAAGGGQRSYSPAAQRHRGQDDAKKVVFTVGMLQDIDSMNPTRRRDRRGVRGLEHAVRDADRQGREGLRGRARASPSRGRARADGKTWTYKLRAGPQVVRRPAADLRGHRLHDQPLARGGVAQPLGRSSRTSRATRDVADRRSRSRRRCRTRSCRCMDVYILPKHVWEKYDAKAITKYNGQTSVGSGPFTLAEFKKGQFARFEANPNYWAASRPVDEVVIRELQQRRRDGRRAASSGEIDVVAGRARAARSSSLQKDAGVRRPSRASRAASTSSRSTAATASRRATRRCSDPMRARGDRARDRQADDRRPRAARARRRPPTRSARRRTRRGSRSIPDDQQFTFDLDKAKQILDEARLQGHRRRRHARDARRRPAAEDALRRALGELALGSRPPSSSPAG